MVIIRMLLLSSTIICLLQTDYSLLFLLPLSLFLFTILDYYRFNNLRKSYVYYIFYIQAIVRYALIPVSYSLGDIFRVESKLMNQNAAIIVMIIELLYISMAFLYQNKKYYNIKKTDKIEYITNNVWLYIMVVAMVIIIYLSGFFQKVNAIWNLDLYVERYIVGEEEVETGKLGGVLYYSFRAILLLLLTSMTFKSKLKENYKYILVLIISIAFSSFIIGVSRFSIVTFILPFFFLISSFSSIKMKKKINVALIALLTPVIIITSISKFSRGDNIADVASLSSGGSLNAYFSGLGNVAIGLDAFEVNKNTEHFRIFLNDIIRNIPLLSKMSNGNFAASKFFNYEIYGHSLWGDQIVPLSISGLFHFDVIGIGLYPLIFISLAFFFEKKALAKSYIPYRFVYYSLMLTFSMVFMINFSSFFASTARIFLFVFLPFYVANKLYKLKT